eukprot:gene6868-1227_t
MSAPSPGSGLDTVLLCCLCQRVTHGEWQFMSTARLHLRQVIHIVGYRACPEKIDDFEVAIQAPLAALAPNPPPHGIYQSPAQPTDLPTHPCVRATAGRSLLLSSHGLARCIYSLTAAVTDVRVCHPKCGEVVFVITFITKCALSKFKEGPQAEFEKTLSGLCSPVGSPLQVQAAQPFMMTNGTKMPPTHTLASLLDYLKANIKGRTHREHDVRAVSKEMEMWFPRESEYSQYIKLDAANPKRSPSLYHPSGYTRNVVFHNDHMDVLLMCWPAGVPGSTLEWSQPVGQPLRSMLCIARLCTLHSGMVVFPQQDPGSMSTIHDHEESSCWVALAEGTVHEVQYTMPRFDMKFTEAEKKDPATATGHCGPLKVIATSQLIEGGAQALYANNDIGLHRVENRSGNLACTLHVYAPPLTKMRIFTEEGHVHVHSSTCTMPDCGTMGCEQGEGPFDMEAWNNTPIAQCTRHYS